jgi:hypothetical protein
MHKLPFLIAIPAMILAAAALATSIPANTQKGGYNDMTAQELNAAEGAAESARSSKDIEGIHDHLQAVVNCLVGPQGPGYVATTNNPCTHMGKGALHDVMQGSDESRLLNDALNEAKDGLKSTSVDDAHSKAKDVWGDIDNAKNSASQ